MNPPLRTPLKLRLQKVSTLFRLLGYAAGLLGAGCMWWGSDSGREQLRVAAVAAMGSMVICFAIHYSLRMLAAWLPDRPMDPPE